MVTIQKIEKNIIYYKCNAGDNIVTFFNLLYENKWDFKRTKTVASIFENLEYKNVYKKIESEHQEELKAFLISENIF